MRFLLPFLIVLLVHCALSFRLNDNYVNDHDADINNLSPEQLPPQDPAIHSFPTVPTVPLVPTCTKKGYFRDPFNCRKFYRCEYKDAVPMGFYCRSSFIFNTVTNSCDDTDNVEC